MCINESQHGEYAHYPEPEVPEYSPLCMCVRACVNIIFVFHALCGIMSFRCAQVHANCRLRRIYFTDRIQSDKDLQDNFRLAVSDDAQNAASSQAA